MAAMTIAGRISRIEQEMKSIAKANDDGTLTPEERYLRMLRQVSPAHVEQAPGPKLSPDEAYLRMTSA